MENIKNLELNSKLRLFRFQDGTILDVAKIDYITVSLKKDDKYVIQINGKLTELEKNQEVENLIETWDMYLRNEEQNAEHTYLHEREMSAMISILDKKLDIVLTAYTMVHKDVVPEYSLGKNEKEG